MVHIFTNIFYNVCAFFMSKKCWSGVTIQTDKDNNIWLQYFAEIYFIIFLEEVKETSDANSSLVK